VCFQDEARIGQKNKMPRRWEEMGAASHRIVSAYMPEAAAQAIASAARAAVR